MFNINGWNVILACVGAFAAVSIGFASYVNVVTLWYWKKHMPVGGYPPLRVPPPADYSLWDVVKRLPLVSQQFWLDRSRVDPLDCPLTGIHIFVGEQGAGKTYSAVAFIRKLMSKYPASALMSNINIDVGVKNGFGETNLISSWGEVEAKGEHSTFVFLDEIQTWGSSLQSKQAPPELLALAAQQRKRKMALIGTVQVPGRLIKPIREQVKRWYMCSTYFGLVTRVAVYKGLQLNEDGDGFEGTPVDVKWSIQSDIIRRSYDTLEIVEGADLSNWGAWNNQPTSVNLQVVADQGK